MKTVISMISSGLFVGLIACMSWASATTNQTDRQTVNIVCSQDMQKLTNHLITEYSKLNPSVQINLSIHPDQKLSELQTLSFVTDENLDAPEGNPFWKIVIAHDAVIPVMNSENPLTEKISQEGITPAEFNQILSNSEKRSWEKIINGGLEEPIHIFIPQNEQAKSRIAAFANMDPVKLNAVSVPSSKAMIAAIQKDLFSIGFFSLSDLFDPATNTFYEKVSVIPIDKNQNGRIDYFEDIYAGKEDFIRGVWIGKYPRTLCSNVYALAPALPTDKDELDFLNWIINDGQRLLMSEGYSELTSIQKQSDREAMAPATAPSDLSAPPAAASNRWIPVLLTLILAGIILLPFMLKRKKKPEIIPQEIHLGKKLNEDILTAPAGYFFGKTHTWAFMERDGNVKIGIDDFIQHVTGPVTRIVMKSPGEKVRKGEILLTIVQEGKQLDLYAPVSGVIRENNPILLLHSRLVNSSPYNDGWIYMIEPVSWLKEIHYLLMGTQYREWIKDEFARLKEFFANSVRKNSLVYAHVVLQDGGEIADNVLADMGPDVWEEFQKAFIDKPV